MFCVGGMLVREVRLAHGGEGLVRHELLGWLLRDRPGRCVFDRFGDWIGRACGLGVVGGNRGTGLHLKDHLAVVAHVGGGQLGVLGVPVGKQLFELAVTFEVVGVAEVDKDLGAMVGDKGLDVLGVGEIDLGEPGGDALFGGVEVAGELEVDFHAGGADGEWIVLGDAGDYGEGVMGLGCPGGVVVVVHVEEDAGAVDQADLRSLANESDGGALDDGDAEAVGQQAHDGGVLDPGKALEFGTTLGEADGEDVAVDILAEDGEELGAGEVADALDLDSGGAGYFKAVVVQEVVLALIAGAGEQGKREDECGGSGHAAPGGARHDGTGKFEAKACAEARTWGAAVDAAAVDATRFGDATDAASAGGRYQTEAFLIHLLHGHLCLPVPHSSFAWIGFGG